MSGPRQNGRRGLLDRIIDAMPQNERDLNRFCDLAEDKLIEIFDGVEKAVEKAGSALIRKAKVCISGLCDLEEEYTYTSTVHVVATGHGATRPDNENEAGYTDGTEMHYFHPQPRRPITVSHIHLMAGDGDLSRSLDVELDVDADDEHDGNYTEDSITDSDLPHDEHNSVSAQDGSNASDSADDVASGSDAPLVAVLRRPVAPNSQYSDTIELPRLWMASYASVGTQTSPAASSTLVGSPTPSELSSTFIPSPAVSAVLVTSDDAASGDSEDDTADYFVIRSL